MNGDDETVGMVGGWLQKCSVADELMMNYGLLNEKLMR